MSPESVLLAIEVAATVAFALSGILEATRRRMDVVGVFSVAFASAFGGGTVYEGFAGLTGAPGWVSGLTGSLPWTPAER